ncbi:hypothetical protein V8C86DRAFT_1674435 [Haematococcus lacustris]
MPCVLVLFDPLQNPLHRQSLGATRFQSGTAVKSSVTAAKAALKTMPPSLVHRVKQQQPVQTKAEATVAAMAPLFSGVTAALSSLAQRGADKHSNGVLHAAVMATQANAVKALEYSGDSSKHFAFLQSCMQQGMAGFGLAMPTATAGAGSSTAQHRVMEEEEEEEEEVEVVYDSQRAFVSNLVRQARRVHPPRDSPFPYRISSAMAMGMWDGGQSWMDDVESDDDIEVVIALSVLPLLLAAILPLVADLAPPQ